MARDPLSTKWATDWRRVAAEVAADLGADWVLTGAGGDTALTLAPVGWWLRQVDFNPSSSGRGSLAVRYVSLTVPYGAQLSFQQSDYYEDDKPRPDFAPGEDDAAFVLRWWISGPGGAYLDDFDEQREIAGQEKRFANNRDRRPIRWPLLAGWRLLLDSGPAEPVIQAQLDRLTALAASGSRQHEQPWWTEFLEVVQSQDRAGAVAWLDAQRRATLRTLKVPDAAIADAADLNR